MDLKDHSQRAAAGGTTEGRRGLGGGCWGPCFPVVEGWGSPETPGCSALPGYRARAPRPLFRPGRPRRCLSRGRCVRDSRRSWTGCERAADVGRRPGAPRRSGSAQGARSGASGARPPSWSRWRRPGGPRRDELELGPERDESATPRTWTPGWSPVSRGAAGGENVPACMPTGTTFSRTVKPSVNYAVPPSSTSADIYLNFVELFSSIGCPEKVTTLPTS
ncbi:translation initiation factor IF-2-like [Orcinus orca]|uniref:translation initiation factor IF-2-like n=1 Tax=Orcinus orca TaxID=9733 RepID=UPI00211143A8|nr:translation initiation factor IF-2-like [Orcinus orca]